MHAKAVTSKTESELANRQSHGATFAKVVNGRKQPVRGLWRRGDRYYAQLTVEDPFTGHTKVRLGLYPVAGLFRRPPERIAAQFSFGARATGELADHLELYTLDEWCITAGDFDHV